MRKAILNLYMAIIMFLLGLFMATSGFILWLAYKRGSGDRRGGGGGTGHDTFWGVTKNTWMDLHDWVAVALLVFIIIHIYLHRKWIIRMLKQALRNSPKRQ